MRSFSIIYSHVLSRPLIFQPFFKYPFGKSQGSVKSFLHLTDLRKLLTITLHSFVRFARVTSSDIRAKTRFLIWNAEGCCLVNKKLVCFESSKQYFCDSLQLGHIECSLFQKKTDNTKNEKRQARFSLVIFWKKAYACTPPIRYSDFKL